MEKLARNVNVKLLYLDFNKAFDLVDFSILLRKLKVKGIDGKLLIWIQREGVRVGDTLSDPVKLVSGVPQGSVLGQLLFLVYISYLGYDLEGSVHKILKYADDSKVIGQVSSMEDVEELQSCLKGIYSCTQKNNMKSNDLKFQLPRMGKDEDLKENSVIFSPDWDEVIE